MASKSRRFKLREHTRTHSSRSSRGSPLLNRGITILTTIVNLDHKQSNEWKQLWSCLLDVQSLCRASMTCWSWNYKIGVNDSLWKPHCLAIRAVCKKEIDNDLKSGYSWRLLRFETKSPSSNMLHCLTMTAYLFQDALLRNYQKSKVKLEWLSGTYSNICSPINLPEKIMYPMDAETWGEILEAELKRCKNHEDTIALRV